MTKKAMVAYIERTNLVVNFNEKQLMAKTKAQVEYLYNICKTNYEKGLDK